MVSPLDTSVRKCNMLCLQLSWIFVCIFYMNSFNNLFIYIRTLIKGPLLAIPLKVSVALSGSYKRPNMHLSHSFRMVLRHPRKTATPVIRTTWRNTKTAANAVGQTHALTSVSFMLLHVYIRDSRLQGRLCV